MNIHHGLGSVASISILISVLLAACAPDDGQEQSAASPEQVFEKDCGACHRENGGGPTIAELRMLSTEDLRAAIIDHPTAGQIPERLPAARVDDLINFIEGP
jgi:mono/diheme cytochrome c family protein